MKQNQKVSFGTGAALLGAFGLWTVLVRRVDVRPVGPLGSSVGMAVVNVWFHRLTGVHWKLYTLTDWLGLVPVAVCLGFALLGMIQLVRRRSLWKVDRDIRLLGGYYILVVGCYLLFEAVPINCRPVLIGGRLEASYPSSTTLLVLGVMPTLAEQINRRAKTSRVKGWTAGAAAAFSAFVVTGRLLSGVHWLSDIIGAVLLSLGLFFQYKALVQRMG